MTGLRAGVAGIGLTVIVPSRPGVDLVGSSPARYWSDGELAVFVRRGVEAGG